MLFAQCSTNYTLLVIMVCRQSSLNNQFSSVPWPIGSSGRGRGETRRAIQQILFQLNNYGRLTIISSSNNTSPAWLLKEKVTPRPQTSSLKAEGAVTFCGRNEYHYMAGFFYQS